MKTNFRIFLLCLFLLPICVMAQTCVGNYALTTQAGVISFQTNSGPCTSISGNLTIGTSADITDLSPLSGLTEIGGNLIIETNAALTNLNGLSNIVEIGGNLEVFENGELLNIDGLIGLNTIGGFTEIIDNAKLMNLDGLNSLSTIGDYLEITNNAALAHLDGLRNVTTVGGNLIISDNDALALCCGVFPLLDGGTAGTIDIDNNLEGCNEIDLLRAAGPCPAIAIPTLSQWGIILLGLLTIILGIIELKSKIQRESKKLI